MLSSFIAFTAAHALLFAFCDGCEVRAERFSSGSLELPEAQKTAFQRRELSLPFPSAREQGAQSF
jgi:hypothetical protein